MDLCQISRNVRKFREAYGESRKELAKYLNISMSAISKYEIGNGDKHFSDDLLWEICIHYNITLDQLANCEVPDFFSSKVTQNEIRQVFQFLFPMALPDVEFENQYFLDAYLWENHLLSMIRNNDVNMYPDVMFDWDSVVKCRNNYNLAMRDRRIEVYAKINYVSFIAFCAWMADWFTHAEKASLVRFKDKSVIVPKDDARIFNDMFGLNIEAFYNRLHQEKVMNDVQGLILELCKIKKIKPMADYYDVLLYFCDYVPNRRSRQVNIMIFDEALWKLSQRGNRYARLLQAFVAQLVK